MDPKRKKMQASWEENSNLYQTLIGITGRRPVDVEFDAVVEDLKSKFNLSDPSIRRVLDVGCSNGYLLQRLEPVAPIQVGVDFCLESLQNGRILNPGVRFIKAEISFLPFPSNYFDRVLCYNMYHYLPSIQAGLDAASELFRVLGPGGTLLIGDLFTEEHRHLIPTEDRIKWNSPDRSYLHRMENWLFMPLHCLKEHIESFKGDIVVLPQEGPLRCHGYRFDVKIFKKGL